MKKARKTAAALIRLAIGLAIIIYLFRRIDTGALYEVVLQGLARWHWLVCAMLLFMTCLVIGTTRWKLIMNAQDLRMSWIRTFCIYFIGHFFNSFMFGATGGDLVRAYYATKETHHKKTEAVATVIIDRLIGMIVLFIIAGVMLVVKADFYMARPETRIPAMFMLIMIVGAGAGIIILYNLKRLKGRKLFLWISGRPRAGPAIRRTVMAFDLYRRRTAVLVITTLLSFANHLFIVLMCYCIGRSLQVSLGIDGYLASIPMIMSIAAIPVTPGGLGVREGLAVTILGTMGVSSEQALPLSLMVYALGLVWSLVGGAIFLCYSTTSGRTLHGEMTELRKETAGENGQIGVPGAHE